MISALIVVSFLAVDGPATSSVETALPRLTWGIGGFVGVHGEPGASLPEVLGSYVRLGVQQSDLLGFDLTAVGALGLLNFRAGGTAMVTLTPSRTLTFGLGGIVTVNRRSTLWAGDYTLVQVGGAGRIDVHAASGIASDGGRRGFTFGLQVHIGSFVGGIGGPTYAVSMTFGYSRY